MSSDLADVAWDHLAAGGVAVLLALIWRPLVLECVDPGYLRSVSRAGGPAHIAFLGLVVLTLATVSLSFIRMGPAGHLTVGLLFGAAKAALVVLVFMHLIRSPARTWLAAGVGLFWLGILVVLTLNDYFARPSATF